VNPTIIIVDDEPDQLALITAQLERGRRFATKGFTRPDEALEAIRAELPDAVICDLVMPHMDGVALTRRIRELSPALPILILTPRGQEAEAALQMGATDFLAKPVDPRALETRLRRALEQAPAQEMLTSMTAIKFDRHGIVGQHPLVQAVREFVDQVAGAAQVSALLLGESGTGKNLVARAVHGASGHAGKRFVEMNCAAFPPNLLEAELFGYERRSSTEGRQSKRGLMEVADGGTLLLDEISTLPPEMQAKLLDFLESRRFRRVGSPVDQSVSVRVVASTNADLAAEVRAGRFREDLYRLLGVAGQVLPPLRAIRSDIPELAGHFVKRAAEYFGKPVPIIDPAGLERLQRYDWPGNARELRNVVERGMIFSTGRLLQITDPVAAPAPVLSGDSLAIPRGLTLEEVERLYIEATLQEMGGSVDASARRLGVSRKVLWQRRKKHGIELVERPGPAAPARASKRRS
jgi:DNA-binding NtrC family response regulator